MFFPIETFRNRLGEPEEKIIGRLILSEPGLIRIYETYVF